MKKVSSIRHHRCTEHSGAEQVWPGACREVCAYGITIVMDENGLRVVGVDGSPTGNGRTAHVVKAVLSGVVEQGCSIEFHGLALGETELDDVVRALHRADAVVLGTPVHRAGMSAIVKALLDKAPRGRWGETTAPLQGKPAMIVATGGSQHHFLALNELRAILAGFFAMYVIPPGLYVGPGDDGSPEGLCLQDTESLRSQTLALVLLARAIQENPVMAQVKPQA